MPETARHAESGISQSCRRDFHEKAKSVMACIYCACQCHKKKENEG